MGLRELLILILILTIVVVVLRGLYVALRSRRGQIKIALEKNIPEYDLEELEMSELPNGGARQVERSFAEVLRQNSAHAAKANATASGKPSTLRPGAKGLKTNLSRSGARTAAMAAAAQPKADEAVKTTPVADPAPELDFASIDEEPLFDEDPLDEPITEPAIHEPEIQGPVFSFAAEKRDNADDNDAEEDFLSADTASDNFADDNASDEDDTDVFGEKIQREEAELDDVLDELLQKATPAEPLRPSVVQTDEFPEPALTRNAMAEPDDEPEYEPEREPEIDPDYEPEPETDPGPEYEPEPEPEYEPEPAYEADPLPDHAADDADSEDSREPKQEPKQEPQTDSQSDLLPVEDDMPDFDNEYIADPEPQPEEDDSFAASRDDDMDVLFDDDDRERRIAALEEQQDSAPKRFMSWVGGAFGRAASASKARAEEQAEARQEEQDKADKADKKARKKLAKAEKKQARRELEDNEAALRENQAADDDYDDDGILSVREKERPGAAERARAEQLQQSQLDLDDDDNDDDVYAQEEEPRSQELPAHSEVLVINVMARPGTELAGDDLLPVLMSNGLKFGEMSIFHRHTDKIGGRKNGPVMFSVANALNPGTFDLNRISEFSTLGVCFFMTLPNVVNNMMAFEQMLATAKKVQAALDAEIKDDNRSVMTAQTVEHYRQRIRDFELQELKNAHSR